MGYNSEEENQDSGGSLKNSVSNARAGKNAIKFANKMKNLGNKTKTASAVAKKSAIAKGASAVATFIVANPVVLVVALVMLIILIISIFFIVFLYYLTSGGVLIAVKGFLASLTAVVSSFFVSVTNTWEDFVGADGYWGIQATKEYVVSKDLYDENNEFDNGYIAMMEMEHQLLSNAYNRACVDVKSKCKKEGWSYRELSSKLEEKYPNGYEDVYKDLNWAELAIVLDFGFYNQFYTDDETITAKSDDSVTYIKDKFLSDSLEGKGSRYMQYFYYLSYEEKVDENGNTYIDPTINMFTWGELYEMFQIKTDQQVSEDETVCFIDLQEQMLLQAKAQCKDANDQKRVIYDTLRLDSDAVRWSYDFANESVADYLEDDVDEDDNDCPIDVVTPFDTSEWYSSVPEVSEDCTLAYTYQGWMKLYTAPTCIIGTSSYFVNTEKATQDIVNDMNGYGINVSYNANNWCGYEYGSWKGSLQGIQWQYGEGGSAIKNGRYLVAVAPGLVHRDYWCSTGGVSMSSSWYEYGSKLMDLVLQDNETGKVFYVPITTGDAKAHSFPYGIIQTGIHTPNAMSAQIDGASFIYKSDFYYKNLGTAQDYYSTMNTYDNYIKQEGYSLGIGQWMSHGMIEWCYKSKTMNLQALRRQFKMKGVIVY